MKTSTTMLSLATILIASLFAGAGTFAYFSDEATSTGNTFTAGTLDLKIKDGGSYWADGVGVEWSLSDMKPGDTVYGSIDLKNYGTIAADHLEITCSYTIEDPPGPESDTQENTPADYMADYIIITLMDYMYPSGGGTATLDLLTKITDTDADGIDLLELKTQEIDDIIPAPLASAGSISALDMILKFSEDAGNDFQGDILTVTIIFTINQHSSQ